MKKLIALTALLAALSIPALAQKGPENELGFQPGKLYDFSEIDSVNLYNGNLMITVPIGPRKQVSSTLSYQLQAIYNGKVWDFESWECDESGNPGGDGRCEESIPNRRSNAGMGWRVSFGRLLPPFSPSVHKKNSTDTRSAWIYEGPTGDEHPFYGQPGIADVLVAMDASALRLVRHTDAATERGFYYDVEFPSGEVHRFDFEQGAWRLRQISDRFVSFVKFTYEYDNERRVTRQHILDSTLTAHTIKYQIETALHEGVDRGSVVDYVDYTGVGARSVRYDFKYDRVSVRQFRHNESKRITLPMLMWIEQPDLTRYSFTYSADPDSISNDPGENGYQQGTLGTITVPTGGKTSYYYRGYSSPAKKPCHGMSSGDPGISRRVISDGNPFTARTWSYIPSSGPGAPVDFTDKNADYCCTGSAPSTAYPLYWLRTSVLAPMDKPYGSDTGPRVRTDHYFDAWSFEYEFPPGCPSTVPQGPVVPLDPWAFEGRGTFGYPGTMAAPPQSVRQNLAKICILYGSCPPDEKTIDADGRKLTTEVYVNCAADGDCTNGTLARSTWTSYEAHPLSVPGSPYPFAGDNDVSFQLKSTKTIFHDDTGCVGGECWVTSDNFEDNGAGNYGKVVEKSNFQELTTKTTTTGYDDWTVAKAFDKNSVWITGLYSEKKIENGTETRRQLACFDPDTGFLQRTRILSDHDEPRADDVITVFEHNDFGDVSVVKSFGGDKQASMPLTHDCGTAISGTPWYQVETDYWTQVEGTSTKLYTGGIPVSSRYVDRTTGSPMSFKSLDRWIDVSTGAVLRNIDSAGVTAVYTYEASPVRLKSVEPQGGATSSYEYKNATATKNAHVIETVAGNSGVHATNIYEYDGLGRIRRVSKTLPNGKLAVVETSYDSLGRTFAVSQPAEYDEHPFHDIYHEGSLFLYDPFDRQKQITAADGATTTFDYTGVRVKTRTQTVSTPEGDQPAVVTEVYDQEGRLHSVTEQSGPGGADVTTNYEYDINGSLIEVETTSADVTQTRTFDYDERGFLERESHPETQDPATPATDYTTYTDYDARGHAWKRTLGGVTVDYTFDAAERLTDVAGPSGPIKKFIFGDSGSLNGKLWKAIRHNELASAGNVDVTETYSYSGNGQVGNRKTLVERVTYGPGNTRNATKIQEFDYNVTYDEHLLPRTITMPTCPGCSAEGSLGSVTNKRTAGYLTEVEGFAKLTYHPSGMVATVEHQALDKPTDTYSTRNGLPRPSKITFTGCTSTKPFFLPGLVRTKIDPNACGIQVTWPAATLCGGASTIKYRVLRDGNDVSGCMTGTKFLDTTAVQGQTYLYTIVAEGPKSKDGSGICQGGETETIAGKPFAYNTCEKATLLTVDAVTASIGVRERFTAKLVSPNGAIVDELLTFSILGEVIGTAKTGPTGVAAIDHAVLKEAGTYVGGITVNYAGGLFEAAEAKGDIKLLCDFQSYRVKPLYINVAADGSDGHPSSVIVDTSDLCGWSVKPAADGFLAAPGLVKPDPSVRRKGFDTFTIDIPTLVDPNVTERATYVRVNEDFNFRDVIVEQSKQCSYRFSPSPVYVPFKSNLSTQIEVSTQPGCKWLVTADENWVNFDQEAKGEGPGYFSVRLDQNNGRQRMATLSINGGEETGRINQYAPPPVVCPVLVDDLQGTGSISNWQNVSLRVNVSGTYLTYKWYADGRKIRDCDDESCAALALAPGFSGYPDEGRSVTYQVVVENSCDGVVSREVTIHNQSSSCRVPVIKNSFPWGTNEWPFDQISPRGGFNVRIYAVVENPSGSQDDLQLQWYEGFPGDERDPVSDADGGKTDEIEVNPHRTTFYWLKATNACGSQTSRSAAVWVLDPPRTRRRAVGTDFNSDGSSDIPWQNKVTGATEIWTMNGINRAGTVTLPSAPSGSQIQSFGDIDDDERPDLVLRNPQTGANDVWVMNGTTRRRVESIEPRTGPWTIGAVADLDNDYSDDIIWHNAATGENEIWFQTGTDRAGTWALPASPSPTWGLHGTADFNRDEKPDLFFHDRATGQNAIWYMNDAERNIEVGTSSTGAAAAKSALRRFTATVEPMAAMPDTNWMPSLIADFNRDGRPDIVWRNGVTGENSVWLMNGSTVTSTVVMEPRTDPDWTIGGGGSTNAGNTGGGTTPGTTATAIAVVADPAPLGKATAVTATLTAGTAALSQRQLVFLLNGNEVTRVLTDTAGSATAALSVTGLAAGTHANAITVRFDGDKTYQSSTASANLVITAQPVSVTWANPAPIVYGTALSAAQLNATADVPGTFVYNPPAGNVPNAGYATLSVTFTPADTALAPVTKQALLVVSKAPSAATWAKPEAITYGTPLSELQLNATSTIPGELTYDPEPGTILPVGTAQTLRAAFQPDSLNFEPSSATTTIDVTRGQQLVRWNDPVPMAFGEPLTAAQLNAQVITSGPAAAGAMTYTPALGTVLPEGTHELKVNVAETAFYTAATATVDVVVSRSMATITWNNPAPIVYGTPLSAAQLNATANVPGTFTYNPPAGTILNAGTERLGVTFTPSDSRYTAATAFATINVTRAKPVASWSAPAPVVYGTKLGDAQLNAVANVAGQFEYMPAPGTQLDAGTHELTGEFIPGDVRNYEYVTLKVSLTVNKANQTITWPQPAPIVYGTALSATQLNAAVSVVGPSLAGAVTYAPAAGTLLQAGNGQVLTVSVAATPNYNAASATVTLDVLKATPVLTWPQPAPIVYKTLLSAAQLNATADVPGSFSYAPAAGTLLEAGLHTLTANFTPADTRNYNDASKSVTLEVQKADPVLAWAQPAEIVYGTALSSTQLNATADVPGAFVYTPAAGTILEAGAAQTLAAHFTPNDTRNYNEGDVSTTIDVAKAPQTLVWTSPAPIVYGTPLSATQLNASVQVVGPAAHGALTYTPPAGKVLDAGLGQSLSVAVAETANYLPASASVPIDVHRAPLSLVVDAESKLYGAAVPALTGTLTGVVNGDPITPSYATTATVASVTGTYPITATLVDPNNRLVNYDVTITPSTLTVLPAPLTIAANPASKQYSDPLPQLTATFTGFVLGETPAVLSGVLSIQTTAERLSAPGTYPIAIGGLASANYAITYVGSTFTVTQEDARVVITSPAFIGGAKSGPTTVTLAATVRDISATADANGDADAGDIRNATLTFIDRATNTALCTAPIGLLASTDERTGIATCTFARDFGAALPASLIAGARVGGYYVRDAAADDLAMTISAPTEDSANGGGSADVAAAAGSHAPQTATRLKFNMNLQYDKNAALKGNLTFSFSRTEGAAVKQYELVSMPASMAIRRTTEGGLVTVTGTATLRDVTIPTAPVTIVEGAPLLVTATDAGEPSTNDAVSVVLFRRDGGLWLAAGWDGLRAAEQRVTQGNVQVIKKK